MTSILRKILRIEFSDRFLKIETLKPQRVFLDAMTQFRYLATDEFQFRKQVLSFLRFLLESGATVLFTSEGSDSAPDDDLQFMSDGVIHLDNNLEGRTIRVSKFRGFNYISGLHSLRLGDRGMVIFPRLKPESHRKEFAPVAIASGVPELDELLHGGLERGTVTILTGPTGVGKTTVGLQFMKEAAGRGERSVIYTFEEATENLLVRSEAVNIPVHAMMDRGTLCVTPIEPLLFSADEFANLVRQEVETKKARIVMIDSVAGYKVAMRGENLVRNLHSVCKYLQNMGVTIILVNEIEDITGNFRATDVGISYIADNIVFLRYIEIHGEMRKAIGVLKKRLSDFEKTLREIEITRYGISNHQLNLLIPEEIITANVDRKLLERILTNLLINAIKYSPQRSAIALELKTQENQIIFIIKDNGIGIPSDDQPLLFSSFHRASNVGDIPGTGLGLAIVKQSVELHGRTIDFHSEVNQGKSYFASVVSEINFFRKYTRLNSYFIKPLLCRNT